MIEHAEQSDVKRRDMAKITKREFGKSRNTIINSFSLPKKKTTPLTLKCWSKVILNIAIKRLACARGLILAARVPISAQNLMLIYQLVFQALPKKLYASKTL